MSSSGGDGGGYPMAMMMGGSPIPGLPIAGKDSTIGSPYEYGKFQNFLPEVNAEGPNEMATGLRPEMFQYKSPSGVAVESNDSAQIGQLRDELAALTSKVGSQQQPQLISNQFGAGGTPYGSPGQGFHPLPGQNWYGGPMASS